jgi:hypothetical protein
MLYQSFGLTRLNTAHIKMSLPDFNTLSVCLFGKLEFLEKQGPTMGSPAPILSLNPTVLCVSKKFVTNSWLNQSVKFAHFKRDVSLSGLSNMVVGLWYVGTETTHKCARVTLHSVSKRS